MLPPGVTVLATCRLPTRPGSGSRMTKLLIAVLAPSSLMYDSSLVLAILLLQWTSADRKL